MISILAARLHRTGVLLALLVLPLLGGCSNLRHVKWTEDVRLSDGRSIVVERRERYRMVMDVGAGFQYGPLFDRSWISGELPAPIKRKVAWEGTLVPVLLDILPEGAYLVATPGAHAGRVEWQIPSGEYYACFRLADAGWQRISLAELPMSAKPNLFGSAEEFLDGRAEPQSHVSEEYKLKWQRDAALSSRYKKILRQPLKPGEH